MRVLAEYLKMAQLIFTKCVSFLRQLSTVCFKSKRQVNFWWKRRKWHFSYDFECVTEFLGKDLKSKAQNYPMYQILPWSTEKQQRHDPTFLDVVTHRKWRLWHHTIKLKMTSSNFSAILKDLWPSYIPTKFHHHLTWNISLSEENPKKTCHFEILHLIA